MNNEDGNPVNIAERELANAALDSISADDSDAPRDSAWLRWCKFASIIIVPAAILGLGYSFEDYIEQYRADRSYNRIVASQNVEHDTTRAMKLRFWIGACVGGGLGAIYVARCIVRKTDP